MRYGTVCVSQGNEEKKNAGKNSQIKTGSISIGPETKILIERVIEKFQYPVQSFRSCFGILRYAEKYGKLALEECCHDAILHGKCNYTYIANTISMYAKPAAEPPVDRMSSTLKPIAKDMPVSFLKSNPAA